MRETLNLIGASAFDFAIFMGRVTIILALMTVLLFLVAIIAFQSLTLFGFGLGGVTFWQIMENPPQVLQELMKS